MFTIELSDKIQFIDRSYPTFLDVIGDVGGIIEVVTFLIFLFMMFYVKILL
jgi:hypothetical protein